MNYPIEPGGIEPQSTQEDDRGVERVRAVFSSLSKYVHGKQIYAKNNPTLARFARDFDATCAAFFADESELVISIGRSEIKWRDRVVYDNEKHDESIAFQLYKDGVGEVTIQRSVSADELDHFVDLIKDEVHDRSVTDDIVTRLWRADFENIYYRVLDEYLVGEFGDGHRADNDSEESRIEREDHPDLPSFADKGRVLVSGGGGEIQSITHYVDTLVEQRVQSGSSDAREEIFQSIVTSFFTISTEELRLCQKELSKEAEDDKLAAFLEVILDFTLLPDNVSIVRDATHMVESIVDFVLQEGRPHVLGRVLVLLRTFIQSRSIAGDVDLFFEKTEARFTDTALLLRLGRRLEEWDTEAEDVFAYYRVVGRPAVPALCTLLGGLEGNRLHAAACRVLADGAPDDILQIIESFDLDDPRLALDAVSLLATRRDEAIPELVTQLMYYPDMQVREAVIRYLADVGNEGAILLLVNLLDDSESRVRIHSLVAIEKLKHPILTNKVRAMAFDNDLSKRAFGEQEHVFRTLGRLAGKDAVPEIQKMLTRKWQFRLGRSHTRNAKLLAIRALQQIDEAESLSILQKLSTDGDAQVEAKAQRAIMAMRRFTKPRVETVKEKG